MMNLCTNLAAAVWSTMAILATTFFSGTLVANDDFSVETLSMYSVNSGFVSYDHPSIIRQAARFNTTAPSYLQNVSLVFSGSLGTAVLRICGHEGGLSAPVLGKDLLAPIILKKDRKGMQKISIPINSLLLQNDQFFIVVEQMSAGVKLLSDREKKIPVCVVPNGEKYVYQYLQKADSSWEYGAYAFAVEAEVVVPKVEETVLYHDTSAVVNNQSKPATGCRSIAAADINNDGYIDLLAGARLYINDGHGQFKDKTDSLGIDGIPQAHCFIDIDNDGRTDILFLGIRSYTASDTVTPIITNVVYLNQKNGRLKKVPIQLPSMYSISSFSTTDVNGDGYTDMFIGQCMQPGGQYPTLIKNYLLVNNKKLSFEDKTSLLSVSDDRDTAYQAVCRGSSFVDLNNDNLPDLYISNYYGHIDELWLNTSGGFQRKRLGISTDSTAILSVDGIPVSPEWYSSGCHWMDMDNNGSPDLVSTRYLNPLYVKQTAVELPAVRASYEVLEEEPQHPLKQQAIFDYDTKHSAGVWGDPNNDGRMDCLLLTSCKCNTADFYQQENLNFSVQTRTYGLDAIAGVNDALWMDINNDGALDLIFLRNDSLIVYRNRGKEVGHYVQFDLQAQENRTVAGAKVQVFTESGMYTQQVTCGRGLLMQDPLRLHFGLAESERVDSVRVVWPNSPNYWETFSSVDIDRVNALREGNGIQRSTYEKSMMKITGVRSYPNPFRESVNIEFQLLEKAHVALEIFDVQGNRVVSLLNGNLELGTYKIEWDGKNNTGLKLPMGSYIYHCTIGEAKIIGKLVHID